MVTTRARLPRGTLVIATLGAFAAAGTYASSHREAPFITEKPKVDATDFYLFNSYEPGREHYVTLIANYVPLQDPYGGPNYFALDAEAAYEIHVDVDGDAVEDHTFRMQVDNTLGADGDGIALAVGDESVGIPLKVAGPVSADDTSALNFMEHFTIEHITGDRRSGNKMAVTDAVSGDHRFTKPVDYIGEKTLGDADAYERYVASQTNSGMPWHDVMFPQCGSDVQAGRVFVGQRKDSFSVNLGATFDLINLDPIGGMDDPANDDLADKNVTTIALEVHRDCLTADGNGVIGAWTSASRPQVSILDPMPSFDAPEALSGAWTQMSRLSNPLVNELVIGLADKDRFNASEPVDDAQFATYVTNPTLPAIVNLVFNSNGELSDESVAPSNLPRQDLVAAFLTGVEGLNQQATVTPSEMIRLNTGIPAVQASEQSNFGVAGGDLAGFPNGRRPGDDVVDLALRVSMGALCHELPIDLNGDGSVDRKDNLLVCGDTPSESRAAAPVGTVAFLDGAPQNAGMFNEHFPYLRTPIPGAP